MELIETSLDELACVKMNRRVLFIAPLYTLAYLLTLGIYAQDESTSTTVKTTVEEDIDYIDQNSAYCFRFTWLGPQYDNSTYKDIQNLTCEGYTNSKGGNNVPCMMPLVVTDNGEPPQMQSLWDNYKTRVACKRTNGLTCTKYSYSFNGEILNVTYMCAKVFAVDEGPVTSGCYSQMVNGEKAELCVCESGKGDFRPCNAAVKMSVSILPLLIFAALSAY